MITLLSTEAKYISLSEAAHDVKWLTSLYDELRFHQNRPLLLLEDNNRSLAIANNSQYHKRLKHIDIRWHWIREQIQKELLHLEECRDPQQTADILTKAFTPDKHSQHVVGLGLCLAWGEVLGDE